MFERFGFSAVVEISVQTQTLQNYTQQQHCYKIPELHSIFITIIYDYVGEEKCSMNVHILCHLTGCVKNWGPVWG